MIEYLLAWLIFTLCGTLMGALITESKRIILVFSIVAAIISGVLLLVIWAMLAISQFFGIPLIIVIAVIIIAWFIFSRR